MCGRGLHVSDVLFWDGEGEKGADEIDADSGHRCGRATGNAVGADADGLRPCGGLFAGGETMLELHPQGGDVLDASLRYGPTLAFKFYPPQAGRIRLFCEVKVGGRVLTPAFVLSVEE